MRMSNMSEYGFYVNCVSLYKNGIYDSVVVRENTGQRKPEFFHILRSAYFKKRCYFCLNILTFCRKIMTLAMHGVTFLYKIFV